MSGSIIKRILYKNSLTIPSIYKCSFIPSAKQHDHNRRIKTTLNNHNHKKYNNNRRDIRIMAHEALVMLSDDRIRV